MKNKVSTAVVTAGLLAGILGSAFAPAAKGRDTVVTSSPLKASLTDVNWDSDYLDNYNGDSSAPAGSFSLTSFDAWNGTHGNDDYAFHFNFYTKVNGSAEVELTTADVKVVSSNSKILVALADDQAATDACSDTALAPYFSTTDVQTDMSYLNDGWDAFNVCVKTAAEDTAATGTIKVYAGIPVAGANNATYVLMYTVDVTAMGPVASLTQSIADGFKYVANNNDGLEGWLKIVAKDSNGTVLNGDTASPSDGADLASYNSSDTFGPALAVNSTHYDESDVEYFNDSTADSLYGIMGGTLSDANQYYYLDSGTCDSASTNYDAGDEGTSLSLKAQLDNLALNEGVGTLPVEVLSNAISITCTLNDNEQIITGISATVTSGTGKNPVDADDHSLSGDIIATVTDSTGRPMGDGGNDLTWDFDHTATSTLNVAYDNTPGAAVGGKLTVGSLAPDNLTAFKKYTYTFTVADANKSVDLDQAKTVSLSYTAINPTTIKAVLNVAKTSAKVTVNFGADAAGEYAFLVVETATGTQTEYRTMANASGVATWTLGRRKQTVYLSAYSDASGIDDSNLLAVTYK